MLFLMVHFNHFWFKLLALGMIVILNFKAFLLFHLKLFQVEGKQQSLSPYTPTSLLISMVGHCNNAISLSVRACLSVCLRIGICLRAICNALSNSNGLCIDLSKWLAL